MTDEPTAAVERSNDRYVISVDGRQAGFTEYIDRDGQRIFHHTEIGGDFGGRGLGSALISHALADTRAAGLRIVPVCPFVKKYVTQHPEIDDTVDAVTPDALAVVRERAG